MNNPSKNIPIHNANCESNNCSEKNAYPSEVENNCQKESLLFDTANCQVEIFLEGRMAECLTPRLHLSCGYSIPFSNAFLCKHPKVVMKNLISHILKT
jgi:hypothetical protein